MHFTIVVDGFVIVSNKINMHVGTTVLMTVRTAKHQQQRQHRPHQRHATTCGDICFAYQRCHRMAAEAFLRLSWQLLLDLRHVNRMYYFLLEDIVWQRMQRAISIRRCICACVCCPLTKRRIFLNLNAWHNTKVSVRRRCRESKGRGGPCEGFEHFIAICHNQLIAIEISTEHIKQNWGKVNGTAMPIRQIQDTLAPDTRYETYEAVAFGFYQHTRSLQRGNAEPVKRKWLHSHHTAGQVGQIVVGPQATFNS